VNSIESRFGRNLLIQVPERKAALSRSRQELLGDFIND